jgi:hypothetical protein
MAMPLGAMLALDLFRWGMREEDVLAFADGPRDSPCAARTQVSFAETVNAFRPFRDPVAKADDNSTHFSFRWTVLVSTMSPHRCGPRGAPQRCGAVFIPRPVSRGEVKKTHAAFS